MSKQPTLERLYRQQAGLVSIMVTMVMMILVTLTVLSFSQIIRREQRQTLDRQLSTQAFYAAESGINVAVSSLLSGIPGPIVAADRDTSCATTLGSSLNVVLDAAANVKVSCISVSTNVPNLEYGSVDSHAQVAPMNASGAMSSVTLSWQEALPSGLPNVTCTQATRLRTVPPDWSCPVGLLRVDLVPTPANATRASMQGNQFTAFLYPTNGPGSTMAYAAGSGGNQGSIVATNCVGLPVVCTMKITGLPGASTSWTAKVQSLYQKSKVVLSTADSSDSPLTLSGAQAVIDATGRAQDVLRRVQVRIPLASSSISAPDFGLHAVDGLCKRYIVNPDVSVSLDTPASIVDTTGSCLSDTVGGIPVTIPPGDGYSPTLASNGKIYNMFHHRDGLYIICNNQDLSNCGYWTEAVPTPIYVTPQHSKLVQFNNRLYFPAQEIAGGATHNFGIGCYDFNANAFCGFAVLGVTNFVPYSPPGDPTSDYSAGVDNIALVGGNRLYTVGIDTSGNQHIYCADPTGVGGVPVPCGGFTPYDIGVNLAPPPAPKEGQFNVGLHVSGGQLFFNSNSQSGTSVGCYNTPPANSSCWAQRSILAGEANITSILIGNKLCVADGGFTPSFTISVECYDTASGAIVPAPPNFMTGLKPAAGQIPGAFWSNWETTIDGLKVFVTAVNRQGGPAGAGSIYCYDTNASSPCAGWGVNGWSDGSTIGNDFGQYQPYGVIRVGACFIGTGDNATSLTPPIFKLRPNDSGPMGAGC